MTRSERERLAPVSRFSTEIGICKSNTVKPANNKEDRPIPVYTGRKSNVHITFRRRPGHLLNVLCTFNLRSVSTGHAGKCRE